VIGEAGFMLANVPLTIAASTGTGEDSRGLSAGLLNTSTQLGNAVGLGVVASVVGAFTAPPSDDHSAAAERTRGGPAGRTAGVRRLRGGRPNRHPLRATVPAIELNTR